MKTKTLVATSFVAFVAMCCLLENYGKAHRVAYDPATDHAVLCVAKAKGLRAAAEARDKGVTEAVLDQAAKQRTADPLAYQRWASAIHVVYTDPRMRTMDPATMEWAYTATCNKNEAK